MKEKISLERLINKKSLVDSKLKGSIVLPDSFLMT